LTAVAESRHLDFMPTKPLSEEIRELIAAGGPPYDAKKVMPWFNHTAENMLMAVVELEEDFQKDNPGGAFLKTLSNEHSQLMDDIYTALRPLFERYCEKDSFNPPSAKQHNEFMSLLEITLGGIGFHMQIGKL
jgi:hypothetical protein